MDDIISAIRERYVEGNRYNFLTALCGSLARAGISIGKVYRIYDGIRDLDDEDRFNIIKRCYKRLRSGLSVYSLDNSDELCEKIKLISGVEDSLVSDSYLDLAFCDIDSKIPVYDISDIGVSVDEILTPISYKYLLSRNITDTEIDKWNILSGVGEYSGRVVFPVFNDSKCIYFMGRSYVGHSIKYKYPRGPRSHVIWGYCESMFSDVVIVCEGAISAISANKHTGIPSVALLGSTLSKEQSIMLTRFNRIIWNIDPDKDFSYVSEMADRVGRDSYIMSLPYGEDANSVDGEFYLRCLEDSFHVGDQFDSKIKSKGLL